MEEALVLPCSTTASSNLVLYAFTCRGENLENSTAKPDASHSPVPDTLPDSITFDSKPGSGSNEFPEFYSIESPLVRKSSSSAPATLYALPQSDFQTVKQAVSFIRVTGRMDCI